VVAIETIHLMKYKERGIFGEFSLKIDISKILDKVCWSCLNTFLLKMEFDVEWVGWMKMWVESIDYNVLIGKALDLA